jgi:hypothetical protein
MINNILHTGNKQLNENKDNNIEFSNFNNKNTNEIRISETPESLLLNCDEAFSYTNDNLIDNLKGYEKVRYLLYITTLYPLELNKFSLSLVELKKLSNLEIINLFLYTLYWVYARLAVIVNFISLFFVIIIMYFDTNFTTLEKFKCDSNLTCAVAMNIELCVPVFELALVLATFIYINKRLMKKSHVADIPFYNKIVQLSHKYVIVSILITIPLYLYFVISETFLNYNNFILNTMNKFVYFITIFINGINMMFVVTDARVSYTIVEDLLKAAKDNTLTMDNIYWARNEIEKRIASSLYFNYSIVIISAFNVGKKQLYILYQSIYSLHYYISTLLIY